MPYTRGFFGEVVERTRPSQLIVSRERRLVLVVDNNGDEVATILPSEMRRAAKELDDLLPND